MLFATEIAGATCNHNYEPRWKVFEKVWARIDPQKYKRAQDYNPQQSELTVEEQGTLETVVRTAKTHAARADTSTEVSTIIREAADAAIPARVSHALKTELVAAITSESNCAFGAAKEQHAIEVFTHNNHNIPVTGQNNKFYKMWVGVCPRGTRWGVGGRVDGLTDDRAVSCYLDFSQNITKIYKIENQVNHIIKFFNTFCALSEFTIFIFSTLKHRPHIFKI